MLVRVCSCALADRVKPAVSQKSRKLALLVQLSVTALADRKAQFRTNSLSWASDTSEIFRVR